jgi:hypothetical protein
METQGEDCYGEDDGRMASASLKRDLKFLNQEHLKLYNEYLTSGQNRVSFFGEQENSLFRRDPSTFVGSGPYLFEAGAGPSSAEHKFTFSNETRYNYLREKDI